MLETMRIIVVEDDDDMYENYEDTASDLKSEVLQIELVREKSAESAKRSLLSKGFDGAIIDLNLNQSDPIEASGNIVLKEIVDKHRFPVFVVSGNLQNIDPALDDKKSEFLKFFDRELPNEDIFNGLIGIFNTGITKILGGRGKIEQSLGEIFWTHLANNFGIWPSGRNLERTLLRYTVSHLAEYLDIPDGEDRFYHEAEFYIKPPIREHIATGDILELEEDRFIILSPACDVAVRMVTEEGLPSINADRLVIAPLIKISRDCFISKGIIKENSSKKECTNILKDIIRGKREKFTFLPEYGDMYPAVVDFQNIHTCSFNEYENYKRLATVSSVFLKDIQSRFSSYLARQGQPDLNKDELIENYKTLIVPEDR